MEDELMFGDQVQNDQDSFELDEGVVNEINNDAFEGEKLSNQEMIDALLAVDAIADAVVEKQGGDDAKIEEMDPEQVLTQIDGIVNGGEGAEMSVDDAINDTEEPKPEDEDNLPQELENSVVRVQVGEDTAAVDVDTEVHNDVANGELCTVCETPQVLSSEEFPLDQSCDDKAKIESAKLLTIGNSKSTKFRTGYLTLTSAMKKKNKRAWSSAYKTVRKLIGSRKMTTADWAIVAYIASCKMKKLTSSMKRIVSAFKGSEKLKTMFAQNFKKPIKSNLNAQGGSELDNAGQPKTEMQPEIKNLGSETGKINENVNANGAAGENKEPYGKVSQNNGTPKDTVPTSINAPALDYAEISVPVNNSMQGIVLRKLSDSIYCVVGTRVSSAKGISFAEKIDRPKKGSLKNSCPFNSGSVISLGNGKAILLKNSNTAGMLAFYGDFVKSAKAKVPYFASQEQGKSVVISESKKGTDIFAKGEKIYSDFKLAEEKAKMEKEIRASMEKDYEIRRKQIKSAIENKYNREINSNNQASKKLDDLVRDKERARLFQANQKIDEEERAMQQLNSSKSIDFMGSLMSRMF